MKIGALARRLGVAVGTLRFYEEVGLLTAARSEGGTRRYSEDDLARVEAILQMARLEVPLANLRDLAAVRPSSASGDEASRRVGAMLAEMRQDAEAKRQAFDALIADITRAEAFARRCHGCTQAPRLDVCAQCEVSAGVGDARILALVWDQQSSSQPAGGGSSSR